MHSFFRFVFFLLFVNFSLCGAEKTNRILKELYDMEPFVITLQKELDKLTKSRDDFLKALSLSHCSLAHPSFLNPQYARIVCECMNRTLLPLLAAEQMADAQNEKVKKDQMIGVPLDEEEEMPYAFFIKHEIDTFIKKSLDKQDENHALYGVVYTNTGMNATILLTPKVIKRFTMFLFSKFGCDTCANPNGVGFVSTYVFLSLLYLYIVHSHNSVRRDENHIFKRTSFFDWGQNFFLRMEDVFSPFRIKFLPSCSFISTIRLLQSAMGPINLNSEVKEGLFGLKQRKKDLNRFLDILKKHEKIKKVLQEAGFVNGIPDIILDLSEPLRMRFKEKKKEINTQIDLHKSAIEKVTLTKALPSTYHWVSPYKKCSLNAFSFLLLVGFAVLILRDLLFQVFNIKAHFLYFR